MSDKSNAISGGPVEGPRKPTPDPVRDTIDAIEGEIINDERNQAIEIIEAAARVYDPVNKPVADGIRKALATLTGLYARERHLAAILERIADGDVPDPVLRARRALQIEAIVAGHEPTPSTGEATAGDCESCGETMSSDDDAEGAGEAP